jgi:hypothetical protein
MIIDVQKEINKYKGKGRDELEKVIQEYKNQAIQHAVDFNLAGQYNMVAQKLREICDKLPAPNLKHVTHNRPNTPIKTANLSHEDDAKINDAWKQRVGGKK